MEHGTAAASSLRLPPSTDWRNGSASDSSPEGYAFESRIGNWGLASSVGRADPTVHPQATTRASKPWRRP